MTVLGEAFIPIRATLDKLDGDLAAARGKVEGALGKIGSVASGVGRNLKAAGTLALGGIGAITAAATGAVAGITSLAAAAEPLVGLQQSFATVASRIGTSSNEMLLALQAASGGLITNRQLMESFNKAASLVSDTFASKLPDAMMLVRRAAQATGQDMGFLFDSLVIGIGRVSPMILDNLGIQVSLAEATDRAAQMFGKATAELTKQEQQAALTEIVLEKLNAVYGDVPDVDSTFAKIEVSLANLRDEIGIKLLPVVQPLAGKFLELAERALPPLMDALDTKILPVISRVTEAFTRLIDAVIAGNDPLVLLPGLISQIAQSFGLSQEQAGGLFSQIQSLIEGFQQLIARVQELVAPISAWIDENVKLQDALITLGIVLASVIVPAIISLAASILPVIATVAAVGAAVVAARKAWEENFLGIRDKAAEVWTVLEPLLAAIAESMREKIPAALDTFKKIWVDITWPAVQKAVEIVWPIVMAIFKAYVEWYTETIPQAMEALRSFWVDKAWPAIQKAVEIVWPIIEAIFSALKDFILSTLIPTIRSLHRTWTQEVWPTIQTVTQNVWTIISAIFTEIGRWINDNIVPWIQFLRQIWAEIVWPAIQKALENAWAVIEPIWNSLKQWLEITIPIALGVIQSKFEAAMEIIESAIAPVFDMWKGFVDAVKGFWNWISSKTFTFKIKLPDLPDWAVPGSPLPIHTAWRKFAEDMERITIRPRLDLDAVPAMVLPRDEGPAQAITYNYNYNINAQYAYQDERSLMDDVRLMEMMHT